ncbi:hypothetical protein PGUG_02950 [Meyerozyma guilliermondii ATCC 6260]|uniref:Uncharacterized protein n=1 Tax=Meyerozyma guilliermondii (strain ATCC 6260 / CBS 566 / DSM 6381 / JCM 1539 / NBRC 10279 / NRRL Y-324) TaxID=294746 RepID=A5DI49_PICGU|nr:uncharacterized protein PGUG_02950 [Meyerozyma guilliermondii ATCC 6260]EDK38852.2 hypothetical protein PGUG_02950 [Meyerozyma guilliermondii ATCC 6260]
MDLCQQTGPGLKYAFCLAVVGRLQELRAQNYEKSYLLSQAGFVLEQRVLPKYHDEDTKANKERSFVDVCTSLMLPPHSSDVEWSKKVTSAEIIRAINMDESLQKKKEMDRNHELAPKLTTMLKQCVVSIHADESDAVAEYLVGLSSNIDDLPPSSSAILTETAETLSSGSQTSSLSAIFDLFGSALMAHLAVIVVPESDSHIKILREQGNSLMANSAYPQAIQIYTTALHYSSFASQQHVSQILTNRAIAYIGLNCFPEAITDLNSALVADRTFTPAWIQLGYCHLYMGSGLMALQMYHMALRTMIGDVFPERLIHEHGDVIESYKRLKKKSVMPSLVRKVVSSLLLTERRAKQQHEPVGQIQLVTSDVKNILNNLAQDASEEDKPSFVYPSSYERLGASRVERANRSHPDILSHDIAQDILANTGFESNNVTPPAPPPVVAATETGFNATQTVDNDTSIADSNSNTNPTNNRSTTGSGPGDAATAARAAAASSQGPNIRNILNSIGRMAESGETSQETTPNSMMSDVSRAFIDSFTGGVGAILASSFGEGQNESRNGNQNETNSRENRDTEMPEEPDLD